MAVKVRHGVHRCDAARNAIPNQVCVTDSTPFVQGRRCEVYYGADPVHRLVDDYRVAGFDFSSLSPCQLFARIRGRTLWFVGDSQTWHFYYTGAFCMRARFRRSAFPYCL